MWIIIIHLNNVIEGELTFFWIQIQFASNVSEMASDLAAVNLLAEESTIDPSSTLPSFLEMKLVQETAHAGRKAVHSSIDVVVEKCEHAMRNYPVGSLRQKLAKSLSQIFRRYQAELEMVVHYSIERHYLLSSANSLLSESLYGLRRSKISGNGSALENMNNIQT